MISRIAGFLLLAFLLLPAGEAHAQAQLQIGGVWANCTSAKRPAKDCTLSAEIDQAISSTRGAMLERGAGGWGVIVPSSTAGLPFVSSGTGADPGYQLLGIVGGGTNCSTASGTCLDNITGFSSNGVLQRTGAGTYAFLGTSGSGTTLALTANPVFVGPTLGAAIGTSLALGGCTIGSSALCLSGFEIITSNSATALSVGANGATNPAFNVDASTASSVTGLNVKSAASGGGVAVSAISSAAAEALNLNGKGAAAVNIGNISTGGVGIGAGGGGVTLTGTVAGSSPPSTSGANQYVTNLNGTLTIAMPTTAISAGTCGSATTVAVSGLTTADEIDIGFQGDPTATAGFIPPNQLSVVPYPTSGNINVKYCNNTTGSITPAAVTYNIRVRR